MASDPTKPLLRLETRQAGERTVGRQRSIPRPEAFPKDRQSALFSPKFERLAEVMARDSTGLELRSDPTSLAPERLLVFELRGAISAFASAIGKIPGLELIDEEELTGDGDDTSPVAYLMVPDARALRQIESLWRRHQRGQLVTGETPWRDVFSLLRDLRSWGPADRVSRNEADMLTEEVSGQPEDASVALEIELVYRVTARLAAESENQVRSAIDAKGGRVVTRARIDDIAYHALLVELPVHAVRQIVVGAADSIAGLDPIMYIRPQAIATTIDVEDQEDSDRVTSVTAVGAPILALLDGVPVAAHPLLNAHVVVDDQFGLEAHTPVDDRRHGTAMASLIIHGDRNRTESALPRRIHVVPVLGSRDAFPNDRLVVDLIYAAVLAMRTGDDATAPGVVIVNVSLGNRRRPFHGQLSPWARLLDRLSHRFGVLFIVSAGNFKDAFAISAYPDNIAFEDASSDDRATETLRAIGRVVADRRLLSPAETVNGLTVGGCNIDWVDPAHRRQARVNVDPYGELLMANPSSALGPGFAESVKPDILMPGAREHLRFVRNDPHLEVRPAPASRAAGLKVAAPASGVAGHLYGFTNGTSAATALASRTAHRVHDALEATYGQRFLDLSHVHRAALLKALLVHPASWPERSASLIRTTIGPTDSKYHQRQKDNIRRFLGFGCVDADDAVACADDRATFWAVGTLERDKVATVDVPVPAAMSGVRRPHSLSATLAWFTPILPGRKSYRSVRLKLLEPSELDALRIKADSRQPDVNQTNRGTLYSRRWSGEKAPIVNDDMVIRLTVQRDPDQGLPIDESVPFSLAVTLTMPGIVEIYEQARQRLGIGLQVSA